MTSSVVLGAAVMALAYFGPLRYVFAHDEPPPQVGRGYTPDTCIQGHNICGDFEPVIPMHGAEGVHAGLVWKDRAAMPKILYWARFTDYQGADVADPDVIRALIDRGALTNTVPTNVRLPDGTIFRIGANDFNTAIRGGDFPGGPADTFNGSSTAASTSSRASARAFRRASSASCSTIARSCSTSRIPTPSRTRKNSTPSNSRTATSR
jgi:hypothetical protein